MSERPPLLLLGTGHVGKAVIALAGSSRRVIASSRNPGRLFELASLGVEPLIMPLPYAKIIEPLASGADVLVSFPPDGVSDAVLAAGCLHARCLVYISTTGVYGRREGTIDDTTPPDLTDERARRRLEAERIWMGQGAIILRAPGIYGPESGLHLRLLKGAYKLPGDGKNIISRIHVEDLAAIIASLFDRGGLAGDTYVVGDCCPCSQIEIVTWLCQQMKLPVPDSAPLSAVSHTLRGNRAVDASRIISMLGYSFKYPTYKEGYKQCLARQYDLDRADFDNSAQ